MSSNLRTQLATSSGLDRVAAGVDAGERSTNEASGPNRWSSQNSDKRSQGFRRAERVAVILVHGFGWTMREVAELTGTKVTTVQTHLERGLRKLTHSPGGR